MVITSPLCLYGPAVDESGPSHYFCGIIPLLFLALSFDHFCDTSDRYALVLVLYLASMQCPPWTNFTYPAYVTIIHPSFSHSSPWGYDVIAHLPFMVWGLLHMMWDQMSREFMDLTFFRCKSTYLQYPVLWYCKFVLLHRKNGKVWNFHNIKEGRILIMVLIKWNEIVKLIPKDTAIKYNNLVTSTDY